MGNDSIGLLILLLGQAIAFAIRLRPGLSNAIIPRVVWLANAAALATGYLNRLLEAIGPVSFTLPALDSPVLAFAWGGLAAALKAGLVCLGANLLTAATGWLWEKGGKPATPAVLLERGKG